jgi:L-lactate utilization protein LutC
LDEAADQVFSILQDQKAEKVALSELPEDFGPILDQKITGDGLNLLKPPFNNADLPEAFDTIQVGISWAAFAIAETGAIVEFATDDAMRLVTRPCRWYTSALCEHRTWSPP